MRFIVQIMAEAEDGRFKGDSSGIS